MRPCDGERRRSDPAEAACRFGLRRTWEHLRDRPEGVNDVDVYADAPTSGLVRVSCDVFPRHVELTLLESRSVVRAYDFDANVPDGAFALIPAPGTSRAANKAIYGS